MKTHQAKVLLADAVVFGEGPRWHDGKLFLSDMYGRKVMTVDPSGRSEVLFRLDETQPSGLGWDDQGRLLVVSMEDRKVLRWTGSGTEPYADLTPCTKSNCNDMLVAPGGRAYVGNFGYDLLAGEAARPTVLALALPDGSSRVVADDLMFPNGMVMSPDGKTLIVAETFANRLTAFDVAGDGSLSKRRVFAELPDGTPDGICLDAEGAVWVSCFIKGETVRVRDGGEVTDRVALNGKRAVACMLGGKDRKTLFLCTAETTLEELHEGRSKGFVETVQVDVPGAGLP